MKIFYIATRKVLELVAFYYFYNLKPFLLIFVMKIFYENPIFKWINFPRKKKKNEKFRVKNYDDKRNCFLLQNLICVVSFFYKNGFLAVFNNVHSREKCIYVCSNKKSYL